MLKHDRFPSATSLAIIGVEELGKMAILLNLTLAKNEEIKKKLADAFTSHKKKTTACLSPYFSRISQSFPINIANGLNESKKVGFYIDYKDGQWLKPSEAFDKETAEKFINIIKLLLSMSDYPPEHFNLWKKHLCSSEMDCETNKRKGLENLFEEAHKLGLPPEGTNNSTSKNLFIDFFLSVLSIPSRL